MKSSFVFFLLLCGTAVCHVRVYIYITEDKNWFDAQNYCREHYVDLATITTNEENQELKNAVGLKNEIVGWIGLNRTLPGVHTWQWSDGAPAKFSPWAFGQPDNLLNIENCGIVHPNGWHDANCGISAHFYCYSKLVFVNDNKTWEEALEHCRTHNISLVSRISPEQLDLAKNAIIQTQAVSMWIGLHFVNGQWISVNNETLRDPVSLPSCPAKRYRCGALNSKTRLWESRDCYEKLNFLCY